MWGYFVRLDCRASRAITPRRRCTSIALGAGLPQVVVVFLEMVLVLWERRPRRDCGDWFATVRNRGGSATPTGWIARGWAGDDLGAQLSRNMDVHVLSLDHRQDITQVLPAGSLDQ